MARLSGMTNSLPEEMLPMNERGSRGVRSGEAARSELVEMLFRRHYAALLRLAVVMVGDRGAAEDAVQEAFVSLHRNWKKLRDYEAAEAYLRSAVLNRCRSWVRRQTTQRAPRALVLVRDQHESAEDTSLGREEVGSLVTAMRKLARRQREVLACRFVLEMSVAETAALLDISEGSVKVHTHRGLQMLQKGIEVTR
jgi:RNA polymerase sigma factor (sigma-70 family)